MVTFSGWNKQKNGKIMPCKNVLIINVDRFEYGSYVAIWAIQEDIVSKNLKTCE